MRYITVNGVQGRKVRAKVGDNVTILRKVTVKRRSGEKTVATFPAPLIVGIEKEGKQGRVQARVQFHTKDKHPYVQLFYGSELQLAQPMFKIGDKVEVTTKQRAVLVPVGTQGTVVGGDGSTFVISFMVHRADDGTEYDPPLDVSQSGVDGSALKFIKSAAANARDKEQEYDDDDDSDEDDSEESENDDDDDDDDEDGDETKEQDDEKEQEQEKVKEETIPATTRRAKDTSCKQVTVTPSQFVQRNMSAVAHRALLRHLSSTTLRNFEQWFHGVHSGGQGHAHVVLVDTLPDLQKVLIEFTRQLQPVFRLTPAQKMALRSIGASSGDLLEIEQQKQLEGGSVEDMMRFYSTMKQQLRSGRQ